ncbi:unnamed protein product [Phyllotreta striolata]|uniref:Uncharacterized protein n=1 Tax=Phyllotreta striolata TaxID=444603 RepID=A0A9N9TL11_PHYSR|nr:unnamed protein product [Phyllotreta striolata]
MHRSTTLSEIVSSTFSDNPEEGEQQSKKQKFSAQLGIGLIEFLVCPLYQCYGILLAENIQFGKYTVQKATCPTLIFLSAWYTTAPLSKVFIKYCEERNYYYYRFIITIAAILLAVGIVIPPHYICYGIFGGTFSNVIYTQLRHMARKKFKTTERAFEGNVLSARAISLLVMPHVFLLLISHLSLDRVLLVYSAVVLNIFPAVMIIKLPNKSDSMVYGETNRYRTLPAFSQQIKEMKVFSSSDNTSDITYNNKSIIDDASDDSESGSEEDEDDDLLVREKCANLEEVPPQPGPLAPSTVQRYYSQAGVSILPEIPEEEEDEEDKNINIINSKRLSRISTVLEDILSKETKEIIVPKEIVVIPETIQCIEYIPEDDDKRKSFLTDMKFPKDSSNCCSCSPYTLFIWKRKLRTMKDFFTDGFVLPVFRSLGDLHFYPTFISKTSLNISSVLFISLTPYVTLHKNDGYKTEDMAFLLSYMAFSWCLSLMLLPLLMTFSAVKMRITFVVGLVLSSFSMLLLTKRKMSNDFIIWSALLFGFGYGLSGFAEGFVYRAFAGRRRFAQMERTLSVLLGAVAAAASYLVAEFEVDLIGWFPIVSGVVYAANAVAWTLMPATKEALVFLGKYLRRAGDGETIL